jgi:hypothetical protein
MTRTRIKKLHMLACCLLVASFNPGTLFAQIATGGLIGTVTDSSGAVVPSVKLTITRTATGVTSTTESGPTGTYVFDALYPGTYSLQAAAPGFDKYTVSNIEIQIQQKTLVDIALKPGNVMQTLTVTAAPPLLETASASLGQTFSGTVMNNMPLNGRNWETLSQLSPGVTISSGSNSSSPYFSFGGTDRHQNDFTLDGIDNNVALYAGSQVGNDATVTPPPDAITEFRVQNGDFTSELGRSTGAVVNAVVKSGTNGLHGDLWEYVRNTDFDANDYLSNLAGKPRAAYHENQFGGTAGGPVYIPKLYNGRDKTFWFFDYQGTRIIQPQDVYSTVPTKSMVTSGFQNLQDLITYNAGTTTSTDSLGRVFPLGTVFDPATTRTVAAGATDSVSGFMNSSSAAVSVRDPFFTGGSIVGIKNFTGLASELNTIPSNRLDANAVKLLSLYPGQNEPGFTNNYYNVGSTSPNTNQWDVRIDEDLSRRDTVFFVYSQDNINTTTSNSLPGLADGASSAWGYKTDPHYEIAAGYTHIFTASLVNEFLFGYNHDIDNQEPFEGNTVGIPATYGIQGIPQFAGNGGLPLFTMAGLSNLGVASFSPTIRTIHTLEFADNVTKQYRSHTFKGGFQLEPIGSPILQSQYGKGYFNYTGQFTSVANKNTSLTGIADLLLTPMASTVGGTANVGGVTMFGGSNSTTVNDHRYYMGAYIQDSWMITPRLSAEIGIRWDLTTPYLETDGNQGNLVPNGGNGPGATYYIPNQTCNTPRSTSFNTLAAKDGITITCVPGLTLGSAPHDNFAPRIGIAYRITPGFVVRAGYGIAYGTLDSIGFGGTLGQNYPWFYTVIQQAPNSSTPLVLANGATATMENSLQQVSLTNAANLNPATGVALYGRQYNQQTPYTQTMNLTLQKLIGRNNSIQVGYGGVLSRHLDIANTYNAATSIQPVGATLTSYIPFPDFAANAEIETFNAMSDYHSLQVIYQLQVGQDLSIMANYTYGKCLSDYASFSAKYRAPRLPGFGIQGDYGPCVADAANVLHSDATYELPFGLGRRWLAGSGKAEQAIIGGWQVNYLLLYQTGQPFTVPCAVSTSAFFGCNANLVPGQNQYAGPHNQQHWLNASAFATPPVASATQTSFAVLGAQPYQSRGPGYFDTDASVFKNFNITESTYVQFRAEAFNLTNTPQFGNPGSLNYTTPSSFSSITSMRGMPRLLQFALKLVF